MDEKNNKIRVARNEIICLINRVKDDLEMSNDDLSIALECALAEVRGLCITEMSYMRAKRRTEKHEVTFGGENVPGTAE